MNQSVLWSGTVTGTISKPPASTTTPSSKLGGWLIVVIVAVAVGFGAVYYERHGLPWSTEAVSDGQALGQAFAPVLASSLADGFDKAADLLTQGKTVEEADEALKATFLAAREKAFQEKASPAFAAIVPANSELKDDTARKAYVTLFRDFAKGLRGTK